MVRLGGAVQSLRARRGFQRVQPPEAARVATATMDRRSTGLTSSRETRLERDDRGGVKSEKRHWQWETDEACHWLLTARSKSKAAWGEELREQNKHQKKVFFKKLLTQVNLRGTIKLPFPPVTIPPDSDADGLHRLAAVVLSSGVKVEEREGGVVRSFACRLADGHAADEPRALIVLFVAAAVFSFLFFFSSSVAPLPPLDAPPLQSILVL